MNTNPDAVSEFVVVKNELLLKVQPRDMSNLEGFFENFLIVQVQETRAGFVHLMIEAMKRFNRFFVDNQFSFNVFLSQIVRHLGSELVNRKPLIATSPSGRAATMALYFSNAYGPALGSDLRFLTHRKEYLNNHFYYLINPVQISKFCFLAYPPGELSLENPGTDAAGPVADGIEPFETTAEVQVTDIPVIVEAEQVIEAGEVIDAVEVDEDPSPESSATEIKRALYLYVGNTTGQGVNNETDEWMEWKPELTIFEKGELIPFLACLGIWHRESIWYILESATSVSVASGMNVGNIQNAAQAVSNDGNILEVFSTVSFINSSHRNANSPRMTFTGQSGKSFMNNLIKNLVYANNCRIRGDYQVVFPQDGATGAIFDRLHIPFLFPANLAIPEGFWRRFSDCEHFNDRSVHLGEFHRCLNRDRIDCSFDIFFNSGTVHKEVCTVECKDREKMSLDDLIGIFDKASKNKAKLSFLVCKSIVKSPETESFLQFQTVCYQRKWEVLKVVKRRGPTQTGRIFSIERFHPDICLPNSRCDYSMTCIVLDLNVINA